MSPLQRWIVSSFFTWYCSESWDPAFTCRSFPTYRSVCAHQSSWPQGFSTRFGFSNVLMPWTLSSLRGSDDTLRAGLAGDVAEVALRGVLRLERADPHPVEPPLPLHERLLDAGVERGEPRRDPLGLGAIPGGGELDRPRLEGRCERGGLGRGDRSGRGRLRRRGRGRRLRGRRSRRRLGRRLRGRRGCRLVLRETVVEGERLRLRGRRGGGTVERVEVARARRLAPLACAELLSDVQAEDEHQAEDDERPDDDRGDLLAVERELELLSRPHPEVPFTHRTNSRPPRRRREFPDSPSGRAPRRRGSRGRSRAPAGARGRGTGAPRSSADPGRSPARRSSSPACNTSGRPRWSPAARRRSGAARTRAPRRRRGPGTRRCGG